MTKHFFLPMKRIPTVTHQQKKVRVIRGKTVFYEPPRLAAARTLFEASLASYAPPEPIASGVRLAVKWIFPRGDHPDGAYKLTKPDTDNLQKLFKDCMTAVGFWKDDALVCSEICEKFYGEPSGIYVQVETL